ncbi:heavy-metal-associated domain-containing protein [Flavobacterium croceum]|uniref:Heavy-metal-associated domain-containing protein n=1 Tax=Flavobacterium croceum DSM 17960 TaxID=1121886 RepID=A0A2S4NBG1_9FLAO|nr:heavy metal-associated domain-containing protein [Flavobacterium croceum]POS03031.1 heavy-metal-associated domain-containing protein [Flavobacterium croceum DSM 17960]
MKLATILTTVLLSSILFVGCKNEAKKPIPQNKVAAEKKAKTPATKPETITFHIEGMTCAIGCAKTIEDKLNETDGIQDAKVDFDKQEAVVHFDLDKLSTDDIKKLVESTADGKSYKVSDIKTAEKK